MDAMLRAQNDIGNDSRFLMSCVHSLVTQDVTKYSVSTQKTKFVTYVLSEIGAKRDVRVEASLRHHQGYQYVGLFCKKSLRRTEMFRPE
jgi:hypothetical protein